jgi:hypothetical protein
MLYAAFQLWQDYQPKPEDFDDEIERTVIGVISNVDQNVKRKTGDSLLWDPLQEGDAVYNQDSIRTGLNSYTAITLNDQSVIELEENSLVVLDSNDQAFNVDFKTGEFKTNSQNKNLKIKVKDSVLSANQAQIKIKTASDKETEIQVQKGKALLQGKSGQQLELDTQKSARIDKAGRAESLKVQVVLSSPEDRTEILNPNLQLNYPFTWAALNPSLKKEVFEISTTENFEASSTFRRWAHQAIEAPLKRGDNYWRVGWYSLDPKTNKQILKFTPTRRIKLLNDERVQLLFPENASSFTQEPGNTAIEFRWRSKYKAKLFVFEISSRSDFRQIVFNKRTNLKEITVNELDSGSYYWRVSAYGENNKVLGQSKINKLIVEKIIPQAPELIYPRNNFVWSMPEALRFEWDKYLKADSYQWVLSKKPDMKSIASTTRTKNNFHDWKWSEPGEYFWRVKAYNAKAELVAESLIYKLSIDNKQSTSALSLLSPEDQSEVVVENRDPLDPVMFQWRPKEEIPANYEVLVSRTSAFTKILKFTTNEFTRIDGRLPEEGVYFWKVRWTDPEGKKDPIESLPFSFRLVKNKNLPAPELLEPEYDAEIEVYRDEKISFSWKEMSTAKAYRFILKRKLGENSFKTIVDRNTKELSFDKDKLVPGDYVWFVHGIDANGVQGLKSEERKLKIERDKGLAPPVLNPAVVK